MSKNAFVLIIHKPEGKYIFLSFINQFTSYKVFVIIDDNDSSYMDTLSSKYPNITFIQVDEVSCKQRGTINSSSMTLYKPVTGWDKAIWFFTKNCAFDHVWFCEDDVFFKNEQVLLNIDTKYPNEDLLSNCSFEEAKLNEWLWNRIRIPFSPPYYCGMMCIVRMSKPMLNALKEYCMQYKTMFFLEAMFPTICKHYGLHAPSSVIEEFATVTHRNTWTVEKLISHPVQGFFHPVKLLDIHFIMRNVNVKYTLNNDN